MMSHVVVRVGVMRMEAGERLLDLAIGPHHSWVRAQIVAEQQGVALVPLPLRLDRHRIEMPVPLSRVVPRPGVEDERLAREVAEPVPEQQRQHAQLARERRDACTWRGHADDPHERAVLVGAQRWALQHGK